MIKLSLMIGFILILFSGCEEEDNLKKMVVKEFEKGNTIICKEIIMYNQRITISNKMYEISTKEYKYVSNEDGIDLIPIDNNKPYLSFNSFNCNIINNTIKG